jgi:hypothetical protein
MYYEKNVVKCGMTKKLNAINNRFSSIIPEIMESVLSWTKEKATEKGLPSDAGMCAMSSVELFKRLRMVGIPCKIAINDTHVFVVYGTTVLDLTSTQFGLKELEVGRVGVHPFWVAEKTFDSVSKFKKAIEGWGIPID